MRRTERYRESIAVELPAIPTGIASPCCVDLESASAMAMAVLSGRHDWNDECGRDKPEVSNLHQVKQATDVF